jgi:hypothetical protein
MTYGGFGCQGSTEERPGLCQHRSNVGVQRAKALARAGFEGANTDLHISIGSGKSWQVVALHQAGSQMAHYFQQMA